MYVRDLDVIDQFCNNKKTPDFFETTSIRIGRGGVGVGVSVRVREGPTGVSKHFENLTQVH